MARSRFADPLQMFRFRITIDSIGEIGFHKASGFDIQLDVVEYREGGWDTIHKLPGLQKTGTATFERGAAASIQLYEMVREALMDGIRRTITVTECDFQGTPIRQHILDEAWASKFTAPDLDATSSEVAIESMEIQYEDMRTISLV